jgi:hypothetical protein
MAPAARTELLAYYIVQPVDGTGVCSLTRDASQDMPKYRCVHSKQYLSHSNLQIPLSNSRPGNVAPVRLAAPRDSDRP